MPETRQRLCIYCDYDLSGLPSSHDCPECGRPYDRFSRKYSGRSDSRLLLILNVLGVFYMAGGLAESLSDQHYMRSVVYAFLGMVCMLGAWQSLRYANSGAGNRQYISSTPRALLIQLDATDPVVLAWNDLASIDVEGGLCRSKVVIRSKAGEFWRLHAVPRKHRDRLKLVANVRRRLREQFGRNLRDAGRS